MLKLIPAAHCAPPRCKTLVQHLYIAPCANLNCVLTNPDEFQFVTVHGLKDAQNGVPNMMNMHGSRENHISIHFCGFSTCLAYHLRVSIPQNLVVHASTRLCDFPMWGL